MRQFYPHRKGKSGLMKNGKKISLFLFCLDYLVSIPQFKLSRQRATCGLSACKYCCTCGIHVFNKMAISLDKHKNTGYKLFVWHLL